VEPADNTPPAPHSCSSHPRLGPRLSRLFQVTLDWIFVRLRGWTVSGATRQKSPRHAARQDVRGVKDIARAAAAVPPRPQRSQGPGKLVRQGRVSAASNWWRARFRKSTAIFLVNDVLRRNRCRYRWSGQRGFAVASANAQGHRAGLGTRAYGTPGGGELEPDAAHKSVAS